MKEAEMYIINPVKNRLPGGRFFKNIISDAKILYKNPKKINLCVFASYLKAYFIILLYALGIKLLTNVLDGKDNDYGKLNHIKITADTEILKNLGIDVYKINRFNEYVTAEVPPQAIIKCENFVDRQTQ